MQIRCQHCHKPFALNRQEIHNALDEMERQDMNHVNVGCPHCRKMNQVTKRNLMRFAPDWQKARESESE